MSPQKSVFQLMSKDTKIENLVGKRPVIIFQHFNSAVEEFNFYGIHAQNENNFKSFRKLKTCFQRYM